MILAPVAATFVLVGVSASVDASPPAPAETALAPTWSIGAGLGFGFFVGGIGTLPGALPSAPGGLGLWSGGLAPSVSIERMFSHRFALGFGLEGTVTTSSTVGSSQPGPLFGGASLGVSPRFTVSPEPWPVALTVFATTFLGGYAGSSSFGSEGVLGRSEFQNLQLGLSGGLALEKRFFERLAVRIQAQLIRVTFTRAWQTLPQMADVAIVPLRSVGSSFSAGFAPAPSIELRLYL